MAGTLRPATATITIMDDDLGTDNINLNLILPITVNGKTYYWLDQSGNGAAESTGTSITDRVSHNTLDDLLNNGSDTEDTQHNGGDDGRSVIVGDSVLILPTVEEFMALRNSLPNPLLTRWPPAARYWTSTLGGQGERHFDYSLVSTTEVSSDRADSDLRLTIFQVLPASTNLPFRIKVFLEGAQ